MTHTFLFSSLVLLHTQRYSFPRKTKTQKQQQTTTNTTQHHFFFCQLLNSAKIQTLVFLCLCVSVSLALGFFWWRFTITLLLPIFNRLKQRTKISFTKTSTRWFLF